MERDALVAEIIELASLCQTGNASDDERARLERLLEDNADARAVYLRVADDTVTLNDVRRATRAAELQAADSALPTSGRHILSPLRGRMAGAGRGVGAWAKMAVVAACFVGVAAWFSLPGGGAAPEGRAAEPTFARIVSLAGVQWTGKPRREWDRVGPGQSLAFEAGSVEVLYDNGVQFVAQGPAAFQFLSEKQIFATSGKLVARVGPEAVGFEIVTPHATVIDRGTSFGMTIDRDHQTDVVVYEGIVDLDLPEHPAQVKRRLEAGEAMRIGSNGQVGRIASVGNGEFLPPPRLQDAQADEGRVIRSVSDNLKGTETAKYYRVITRGFRDDCQAYVDRLHQWNGVDERGVPPFLLRGDYIMTFNDDKTQHDLRIAVELDQPSHLYLLVDDRAELPDWLYESFTDTGWDVGIDEGYKDVVGVQTEVGAGRSIEWTFSVWKQDVPTASTVLLGSLQHQETESPPREVLRSMYGIVATPLNGERLPEAN